MSGRDGAVKSTLRASEKPQERRDGSSAEDFTPTARTDAPRTLTPEEYKALEAAQTTEEQFRRALRKTARDYGYVHQYHTRFSVGSDPGFPDEVFVNDAGRCIVVECKRVGKEPTAKQREWLAALWRVPGIFTYCWTPADWDEIHDVLGEAWREEAGDGR